MSLINGWDAPLCTGTELLKNFLSFSAFAVVFSIPTLPFTVDIILTSNWGCESAILIAVASSIPGSVSIIMGIDISSSPYFIIIKA